MFEFTQLRILHQDMKLRREVRATFPFEYNRKSFSCIFITDIIPFRLYLTTLGNAPIIFEFEIELGYKAKGYIDNYGKLIEYLEIKYDPNHKFIPFDFFKSLNSKIPSKFSKRPNYKNVIIVAATKRDIEEANKIFFCGWRTNPLGRNVRPKNIEKTRSAFGDAKAKLCVDRNISSRWTYTESAEDLKKLNELV